MSKNNPIMRINNKKKSSNNKSTSIYGINSVRESLLSGNVSALYALERMKSHELVGLANKKGVSIEYVDAGTLNGLAGNDHHQGFVAKVKTYETYSLEELLKSVEGKKEPLFLILDGIEDPHNLGAILRSCDAFGVDGVIMKKQGQVPLNATVARVSTGAINYVKVAVVANLTQAAETLKKNGFWIVSSDGAATQEYDEVDYKCPIALVVGSEGFGISRLLLEHSDFVIKIPMVGHVNSLNASVSAAILISEISRARK